MPKPVPYYLNNAENLPFLRGVAEKPDSFIRKVSQVMHIGLFPSALAKLKTGIEDVLDSKLRKFDTQLDGILLGYENLAVLGTNANINPGYCHIHINVQADVYVFKPEVGGRITGTVLKLSGRSATCLTHQAFTVFVSVPAHLKQALRPHQEVTYTVEKVDFSTQIPFVRGALDEDSVPGGGGTPLSGEVHAASDTTIFSSQPQSNHTRFNTPDSGLSSISDDAGCSQLSLTADEPDQSSRKRRSHKHRHAEVDAAAELAADEPDQASRKRRSHKHRHTEAEVDAAAELAADEPDQASRKRRSRKHRHTEVEVDAAADEPDQSSHKRRSHKHRHTEAEVDAAAEPEVRKRKSKKRHRESEDGPGPGLGEAEVYATPHKRKKSRLDPSVIVKTEPVSSDEVGAGVAVSEVYLPDPQPRRRRSSKVGVKHERLDDSAIVQDVLAELLA